MSEKQDIYVKLKVTVCGVQRYRGRDTFQAGCEASSMMLPAFHRHCFLQRLSVTVSGMLKMQWAVLILLVKPLSSFHTRHTVQDSYGQGCFSSIFKKICRVLRCWSSRSSPPMEIFRKINPTPIPIM